MQRDKREVEDVLKSKGFQGRTGDHTYFIYWSSDGKKSLAKTKTSHGRGMDIGDSLLSMMAKQCGLNKPEFIQLLNCPMSRIRYEEILRLRGML